MTENEAKDILRIIGWNKAEEGDIEACEAIDIAMNALEEIQQYHEIGTVEECKAAVEKTKLHPLEEKTHPDFPQLGKLFYCSCGVAYIRRESRYCGNCGQRLEE